MPSRPTKPAELININLAVGTTDQIAAEPMGQVLERLYNVIRASGGRVSLHHSIMARDGVGAANKVIDAMKRLVDLSNNLVRRGPNAPLTKEELADTALTLKNLGKYLPEDRHKEEVKALYTLFRAAWGREIKPQLEAMVRDELSFFDKPENFEGRSGQINVAPSLGLKIPNLASASISAGVGFGYEQFTESDQERLLAKYKLLGVNAGASLKGEASGVSGFNVGFDLSYQKGQFYEPGDVKTYAHQEGFRYKSGSASMLVGAGRHHSLFDKAVKHLGRPPGSQAIRKFELKQQKATDQSARLENLLENTLNIKIKGASQLAPPPERPIKLMASIENRRIGAHAGLTAAGEHEPYNDTGYLQSHIGNFNLGGGIYWSAFNIIQVDREPIWNILKKDNPIGIDANNVHEQRQKDIRDHIRPINVEIGNLFPNDATLETATADQLHTALNTLEHNFDDYSAVVMGKDDSLAHKGKTRQVNNFYGKQQKHTLEDQVGNQAKYFFGLATGRRGREGYIQNMVLTHAAIGLQMKKLHQEEKLGVDEMPDDMMERHDLNMDRLQVLSNKFQLPRFRYDIDTVVKNITFGTELHFSARTKSLSFSVGGGYDTGASAAASGSIGASVDYINRTHPNRFRQGNYINLKLSIALGGNVNALIGSEKFKEAMKDIDDGEIGDALKEIEGQYSPSRSATVLVRYFKPSYKDDDNSFDATNKYQRQFTRIQQDLSHHISGGTTLGLGIDGVGVRVKGNISHRTIKTIKEDLGTNTLNYIIMKFNRFKRHGEVVDSEGNRINNGLWSQFANEHKKEFGQIMRKIGEGDEGLNAEVTFILNELVEKAKKSGDEEADGFTLRQKTDFIDKMKAYSEACVVYNRETAQLDGAQQALKDAEKSEDAADIRSSHENINEYTDLVIEAENDLEALNTAAKRELEDTLIIQTDHWWEAHQSQWYPKPYESKEKYR
ncbi:MAG: hypothetical protein ACJAUP_001872 [Cellvibrionaceae bacterium]|jgi:hypothetical protein